MSAGITVLVPTVGRMEFLPYVRRSVERQTRRDFRVIVLDNASSVEARSFLEEWAAADPRVEIARVDPRIPMFQNFNRGIRAVDTEFFTFLHDDDEYPSDFLEILVGHLEREPGAAFCGSNYDFIDGKGDVLERRRWIPRTEFWDSKRFMIEVVGRGRNPVAMPGLVFRRDAFGPEGFDESLPIHFGDFVLLLRAAERRGMVVVARPMMRVRMHAGQASSLPYSTLMAMRTSVLNDYLDEYAERRPQDAKLVRDLRRRVVVTRRAGLVWGWMVARDEAERDACIAGLEGVPVERALRVVLEFAQRAGVEPQRIAPRLRNMARAGASLLRF